MRKVIPRRMRALATADSSISTGFGTCEWQAGVEQQQTLRAVRVLRGEERHDARAHRVPRQQHRGCAHVVEHGDQVGDMDCDPVWAGQRRAAPAAAHIGGQEATPPSSSRATVRHVISEAVTPCAASTTYSAASGGDPAHADVKRTAGDGNVEASGERIGCA